MTHCAHKEPLSSGFCPDCERHIGLDNYLPTDDATPETDAILKIASIEDRYLPFLDLARDLERQRNALQAKLADYQRISESGESLGGELEERERRMALEAKLAEREVETCEPQHPVENAVDARRYRCKRDMDYARLRTTVAYERASADEKASMEAAWFTAYDASIDAALDAKEEG